MTAAGSKGGERAGREPPKAVRGHRPGREIGAAVLCSQAQTTKSPAKAFEGNLTGLRSPRVGGPGGEKDEPALRGKWWARPSEVTIAPPFGAVKREAGLTVQLQLLRQGG